MKQFWSILKGVLALLSFAAVVWGAFEAVDYFKDSQREDREYMRAEFANLHSKVDSVVVITTITSENQQELSRAVKSIASQFRFYRDNVDRLDKEQMEQILLDVYNLGLETGKKKDLTVSERRETPWGIVETVYD